MKKELFVFWVIAFCVASCENQDAKYVQSCEGKYGSQGVIWRIKEKHSLQKALIDFKEWYKEPASLPTNCDTIHLYIEADTSSFLLEDTFAISVGRFFFNDSINTGVKVLELEVKDRWPYIGEATAKYFLSREAIDEYKYEPTLFSDSSVKQAYQVVQRLFERSSEGEGLKIVANLPKDVKDPQKLAGAIKKGYIIETQDKRFIGFSFELRVVSPFCKLCRDKTYFLFYSNRNKKM